MIFADREQALRWWNGHGGERPGYETFPGAWIEETVTETIVTRRVIRRPVLERVK